MMFRPVAHREMSRALGVLGFHPSASSLNLLDLRQLTFVWRIVSSPAGQWGSWDPSPPLKQQSPRVTCLVLLKGHSHPAWRLHCSRVLFPRTGGDHGAAVPCRR